MRDTIACFGKGFRTLAGAGAFIVVGILSVAGTLDLTPVVALFVKDPAILGAVMVGVGAFFGYMRYLTTTPIFHRDTDDYDHSEEGRREREREFEPRAKTDAGS